MNEIVIKIEQKIKKSDTSFFDFIEEEAENCRKWSSETLKNYEQIKEGLLSLLMMREVYKMSTSKYRKAIGIDGDNVQIDEEKDALRESLLNADANLDLSSIATTNIAGVIEQSDSLRLRRMIFRATRGKAMCIVEDVDPKFLKEEGISSPKSLYLVIFQSGDFLHQRIMNICDSFTGQRFDIPDVSECSQKVKDITVKIQEAKEMTGKMTAEIKQYLININEINGTSVDKFKVYEMFVRKEIIIYKTLNKLVPENSLIHGLFWSNQSNKLMQKNIQEIQANYRFTGLQAYDITEETSLTPPTHIRSNEFLEAFQAIVNTYGIPDYKEVNPALFTIITFPFLFGIMFGDICHGFLLFLLSSYMCFFKNSIETSKSFLNVLLPSRYLLLLMGLFATFCGICYNDMASIPLDIFGGSCYLEGSNKPMEDCIYPIGIDPRWYRSTVSITFVNSMKMKLSVIVAVSQMSLGVCMKAFNAIHFKSKIDFFFEFVPQIILLVALFGYMDILIISKWLTSYSGNESMAPSIINTMINIPLKGAVIDGTPFIVDMETNQKISLILLLIAVICIPIMLFPKPIILIGRLIEEEEQEKLTIIPDEEKEDGKEYIRLEEIPEEKDEKANLPTKTIQDKKEDEEEGKDDEEEGKDDEEENKDDEENHPSELNESVEFIKKTALLNEDTSSSHSGSEIFIHQLIETIEFVLGTISNTASYLRLWALSLAHSQLAEVFFKLTLWSGIKAQNPILIFIGFLVFATVSFSVLMCMDLMECFLHTLRLHWVEFQNKFYKGSGNLFKPLNFKDLGGEVEGH